LLKIAYLLKLRLSISPNEAISTLVEIVDFLNPMEGYVLGIPEGSRVLKVDCQGKLDLHGQKWKISKALCGEWVQIVRVEQRLQVYYCTTLIRELALGSQRSTIVERWLPSNVSQPKL
jgi:hypothetical protein